MSAVFPTGCGTVVHASPTVAIVFGDSDAYDATYIVDVRDEWTRGLLAVEVESAAWTEYARVWGDPEPRGPHSGTRATETQGKP